MIIPAILRKEEIYDGFRKKFYTDEMFWETGNTSNWIPNIEDNNNSDGKYDYAVVDSKGTCVGYISFCVDWYRSCACNFGFMGFDPNGNINNAKAVNEIMEMLLYSWKVHRVEWRAISGNPVIKTYDKFCFNHGGTKHIMKDATKDKFGNYHDDIIYEIINAEA